jgi:hypothetical protein
MPSTGTVSRWLATSTVSAPAPARASATTLVRPRLTDQPDVETDPRQLGRHELRDPLLAHHVGRQILAPHRIDRRDRDQIAQESNARRQAAHGAPGGRGRGGERDRVELEVYPSRARAVKA